MVLDTIGFALLAAVLLGSSLGAVVVRDVWHAALLLGAALVTVAAVYVTVAADFLAAIQVLVYVGGVLILITFAVMLTRREQRDPDDTSTTRPVFRVGAEQVPGVVALGLFAAMAWVFLNASFAEPAGFAAGESVVSAIGYSLIDVTDRPIPSEGFLAALVVIALVLDAALDGAIHLARREDRPTSAESGGETE